MKHATCPICGQSMFEPLIEERKNEIRAKSKYIVVDVINKLTFLTGIPHSLENKDLFDKLIDTVYENLKPEEDE